MPEKNPKRLLPAHEEKHSRRATDPKQPEPQEAHKAKVGALEQVMKQQREEERKADEKPPERKNPKKTFRALGIVLASVVVLAILGTGFVFFRRHRAVGKEKQKLTQQQGQGPKVLVAKVSMPKPERAVTMPGDVRAFVDVGVFPRVNGYLRQVKVDKGDRVKQGDILAVVESPETDQQVAAARSALRLRAVLAARARRLAPSGVISKSELDNAVEGERSAQADYKRTRALQDYEIVRAPYAGTITARNVDPGALVSATTALFELADPSRLRIDAYVAQDIAQFVKPGDLVEITQDEQPGVTIHAAISRLSDALDPRTRTMLAEIWLDNTKAAVSVGVFVHVTLHVKVPPMAVVPSNAIMSRADKNLVAVVQDNKVHLQPVVTGLDDGKVVQIREGVQAGQTVALDVPSELGEGAPIQPMTQQQQKQQQQAQGKAGPNQQRGSGGQSGSGGGQQPAQPTGDGSQGEPLRDPAASQSSPPGADGQQGGQQPSGGQQQPAQDSSQQGGSGDKSGGDKEKEKKEKKKEQKKDASSKQPGE
jgi:membrane fusion protein, multidrug efflux system